MDKLPPYPLRPQFPFERDITDQIKSRLPEHALSNVQSMQREIESCRQHVLVSARSMGKSISPSDVYLATLRRGYYDTEGWQSVGKLFTAFNNENTEDRIKEFMNLTVNVPKGDW